MTRRSLFSFLAAPFLAPLVRFLPSWPVFRIGQRGYIPALGELGSQTTYTVVGIDEEKREITLSSKMHVDVFDDFVDSEHVKIHKEFTQKLKGQLKWYDVRGGYRDPLF